MSLFPGFGGGRSICKAREKRRGDEVVLAIFIDMFAPKWARGHHNLARFPSWDPCTTPGYWPWYLNVLPTSGSLVRSLFYAFMPRDGIYTCVFYPPPSSPQRRKPGYAALLRIRGNYFRPYLSIPRVYHRGAAYHDNSPAMQTMSRQLQIGGGEVGTRPIFGYRWAAEGLKPLPLLGKKIPKIHTLQ